MTDLQQKAREVLGEFVEDAFIDILLSLTWREATNGKVKSDEKVLVFQHPKQKKPDSLVEAALYRRSWRRILEE